MLSDDLTDARQPFDPAELHRIVDFLIALRRATDPDFFGDRSAVPLFELLSQYGMLDAAVCDLWGIEPSGKTEASVWALSLVNQLVVALAGWAINHQIGIFADPDRQDSKGLERAGGAAATEGGSGWLDDPELARKALLVILEQNVIPPVLRAQLQQAFRALEFGEVPPLFAPAPVGKRRGRSRELADLAMRAVRCANFRYGQGGTLEQAEESVAAILGISQRTLKSWETRLLPKAFDPDEVRAEIDWARKAGRAVRAAGRVPSIDEAINGDLQLFAAWDIAREAKMLSDAARAYREHMAAGVKRLHRKTSKRKSVHPRKSL